MLHAIAVTPFFKLGEIYIWDKKFTIRPSQTLRDAKTKHGCLLLFVLGNAFDCRLHFAKISIQSWHDLESISIPGSTR